jgi:hypothetical protein
MATNYTVKASHAAPSWDASTTPLLVKVSERDRPDGKVFWADCPQLGCGKDRATARAAIDYLLECQGYRILSVELELPAGAKRAEKPYRVTYSSLDGCRETRGFKTLKGARKFATDMVGEFPDFGSNYAVSDDGVGKVTVRGCTLRDLFSAELARDVA